MNPYDLASGRKKLEESTEETNEAKESKALLEEQRTKWLQHPNTKQLLIFLQEREIYLALLARDISAKSKQMENVRILKPQLKSKGYQEILNYVTTGNRPNTDDE